MKTRKVNTGLHEAQEPHTAEDCQINEAPHNHPDMDCGHTVNAGPGVGIPKYDGKGGVVTAGSGKGPDNANDVQDAGHGPGTK